MIRRRFEKTEREKLTQQMVLLRREGLTFQEVGQRLGINEDTAKYFAERLSKEGKSRLAAVPAGAPMPMATRAGFVWQWPPVKTGRNHDRHSLMVDDQASGECGRCRVEDECRRRIVEWGQWFVGCERPLESEVIMGSNQ